MKTIKRFLGVVIILFYSFPINAQEDNVMYVHYINVGQAAAVLLEFPCAAVLIDAGAQDENYHRKLLDYLGQFFARRKDLDSTFSLIMVTHPHVDHNEALVDIAQKFRVDRYIDDGLQKKGSGKVNQRWMQEQSGAAHIAYESFSYEEISKGGNVQGITDAVIDPVNCPNGNPKIMLYSGQFSKKPDNWSETDFTNYNNHSLVIKVLFGKSSFLFTGDLEKKGIQKLLDTYKTTKALDVDVLMVGHHGAGNATTEDYLTAVSPKYAVISCGEWDYGKDGTDHYTTYYYGHPRISTIEMLEGYITQKRFEPITVKAADGALDFRNIHESKRI